MWLPAIISGLVEAAQSQLQTEFQSFLTQRCSRTGKPSRMEVCYGHRRCLLGDRKWPAFHTFFFFFSKLRFGGWIITKIWLCHATCMEVQHWGACNSITPPKFNINSTMAISKPSFLGIQPLVFQGRFYELLRVCRSWWWPPGLQRCGRSSCNHWQSWNLSLPTKFPQAAPYDSSFADCLWCLF